MAAAAILDFTAFRYSDFGRFLVCYSPHETLPETVGKPFLAIFFRVKPYIYWTMSAFILHASTPCTLHYYYRLSHAKNSKVVTTHDVSSI